MLTASGLLHVGELGLVAYVTNVEEFDMNTPLLFLS